MTKKKILNVIIIQEIILILLTFIWIFFSNFSEIRINEKFIFPDFNPFNGFIISLETIGVGLLSALFLISISILLIFLSEDLKISMAALDEMIYKNITGKDIIIVAFLSGIGEELFFRGILQLEVGIVWSSCFFSFLHFAGKKYWFYTLWTFFASLYLGNIYMYTGNLFIVILIHVTNNLISLALWQKYKHKIIK